MYYIVYVALYCITLYTLHYTVLHCIAWHCITSHCIALRDITTRHITPHHITSRHVMSHHITSIVCQLLVRHPPMNDVHVGSPRGEPLRLCLIALRTVSVSEHTNLVQLEYKETVVQINSTEWSLYRNNTKVSMQLTESS